MREQARAAFALKEVQKVRDTAERNVRAKYKTQLLKLPARLHNNGLGQTMAFYLAQGSGSAERAVVGWLTDWLNDALKMEPPLETAQFFTGQGEGIDDPVKLYRRASIEARSLALWLKRFAEAFLEGDAE